MTNVHTVVSISVAQKQRSTRLSAQLRVAWLPVLAAVLVLLAASARAQTTYTVTDTADSATDTGSIRYAVTNAANGDTIDFSSTLNGGTILLNPNNGSLILTQNVTITGPGANLGSMSCPRRRP